MASSNQTYSDAAVASLQGLIKTLRNQCEEKEQRVKSLTLELQRLQFASTQQTTRDEQQQQWNWGGEGVFASSPAAAYDVFHATVSSKDREIEEQRKLLRESQSQIVSLEQKLAAAAFTIQQQCEAERLKKQQVSNMTARKVEETSAGEMEIVLQRQSQALISSCARHIESRDCTVEQMQFEVTKQDRIISALKEHLRNSQQREQELHNRIEDLQNSTSSAREQLMMLHMKGESKLNAEAALNSAYMESLQVKAETLEKKFNEMEDLLRQKDSELQSFQYQLSERETTIMSLNKHIQTMEFELNVKNMNLIELEKDRNNNEQTLLAKLEMLESNRQIQLRQAAESTETRVCDLLAAMAERESEIVALRRKIDQMPQQMEAVYNQLDESEREKEQLRLELVDLEVKLSVASTTGCLLETSKQRERELKKHLSDARAACQALQYDSLETQKLQVENRKLQNRISELSDLLGNRRSEKQRDARRQEGNIHHSESPVIHQQHRIEQSKQTSSKWV